MTNTLLIDAIVRQTTVLLAQLATASPSRATLANTGAQVFASLVKELRDRGLSNKSIADMFGLTLRTYHNRVSRLAESQTGTGRSLWDALLGFVQERGVVTRRAILDRFHRDDERMIRGVLHDLVESGLLFYSGRGDLAQYRAASLEEITQGAQDEERLASFVWVVIKRFEPIGRADLAEAVPVEPEQLDRAIERLAAEGKIAREGIGEAEHFTAEECTIPVGDSVGWEGAVFDHYQAVVTTICKKLSDGGRRSARGEWVGGSTYGFDIHEDHPHFAEVVGFLEETRARAAELRRRVADVNRTPEHQGRWNMRVVAYVGQTVIGPDEEESDDD